MPEHKTTGNASALRRLLTEDLPVFATSKLIDYLPRLTRVTVRFAEFIFVK